MSQLTHLDVLKLITGKNDWPMTAPFGEMSAPRTKPHDGTDYSLPVGTALSTPELSEITADNWGIDFGDLVKRGQDFGNWTQFYVPLWNRTYLLAHTQFGKSEVNKGEKHAKGSYITRSGNTGLTTGPHLHIGVAIGRHTSLQSLRAAAIDFEKDVIELTDNLPFKAETGKFTANDTIRVRDYPNRKTGNIVAEYYKGESVAYDRYYEVDGHVWISYISKSGVRRYMAIRTYEKGIYGPKWGTIE